MLNLSGFIDKKPADRTASQCLCGSRDVIGHVTIR